jgi:hypothetical protein
MAPEDARRVEPTATTVKRSKAQGLTTNKKSGVSAAI